MTSKGFTLIEILIVIGVIAILGAILLPAFLSAQKRSLTTTCAANLQQIGLAVSHYAEDYDQQFPLGGDPGDLHTNVWQTDFNGKYWPYAHNLTPVTVVMSPYVKDRFVWKCPSDTGFDFLDIQEFDPLAAHPSSFEEFGTSYLYNTYLALTHNTLAGLTAYNDNVPSDEHGPDQIFLFVDASGSWHGNGGDPTDMNSLRYNVLMADGHVKNEEYTTFTDMESYQPSGN